MESDQPRSAEHGGQAETDQGPIHVWLSSRDAALAQVAQRVMGQSCEVRLCGGFDLAMARQSADWWDVVVLDLRAPEGCGDSQTRFRAILEINQLENAPPIIAILDAEDPALPLQAIENGAYDTSLAPLDLGELRLMIRRAWKFRQVANKLYRARSQEQLFEPLPEIVGSSESMQRVFSLVHKIAPCDVSVLISGETGTGKSLVARAMQLLSGRPAGPFVAFSCANLPETLVEDELFGHEKGAFTGAVGMRRGRFEAAHEGTLFLDEIGDLPLGLQAKLLRVLQERCFERLGSNAVVSTDFRLLCATHQNLAEMVKEKRFREDLYYRLNVVELRLPALRDRREEIPFLAHYFLKRFAAQFGRKTKRFSGLALHALEEYNWPGNVRELENVVQRAVVMAERSTIEVWHLPVDIRKEFELLPSDHSYEEEVRDFKKRLLLRTLRDCGWSKVVTARTLGIARTYLHRLIAQMQIHPADLEATGDPNEVPTSYPRQVM